ncbi:MAG: ABC transporter substrate-binding protein [Actinomycetota bacterium]
MGTLRTRGIVALVVCAMVTAACGDASTESGEPTDETTTTTTEATVDDDPPIVSGDEPAEDDPPVEVERIASDRGVTADQIMIGVAPTDNEGLNDLFNLGYGTVPVDQMHEAWAAAVNEAGGINGREVVPVVVPVISIGQFADEACIALTEDEEVFVVTGAFSADGWLCITEGAGIPYIGHFGETPDRQERSGGLMFAAEMSQVEMRTAAVQMMVDEGAFDGRRVGLWWEAQDESYEVAVRPLLDAGGVDIVADAALDDFGTDVIEIENTLRFTLERFRDAEVEIILNLSDVQSLLTVVDDLGLDVDIALVSGRAANGPRIAEIETTTDVKARSFAITFEKPGFDGWIVDEGFQNCLAIYDERFPDDPIDLDDAESRRQFGEQCQGWELTMRLLEAAGPNPTVESFVTGGEGLGAFSLPGMPDAFLRPDKHSAGNELRRYEYDAEADTLLPVGDPIPLG